MTLLGIIFLVAAVILALVSGWGREQRYTWPGAIICLAISVAIFRFGPELLK
jgi:drug/metabolite transporter superfamily protein YnfA